MQARPVEPLIAALTDDERGVRIGAANALGRLADRRAVQPLIACLKDPDAWVRFNAVYSLGLLKDPRAVDSLILALKDPDTRTSEWAAWALGFIGDPRAVDTLVVALRDGAPDVRWGAANALGRIKDPRSFGPLKTSAETDEVPKVRGEASEALRGFPAPADAVASLVASLKDPDAQARRTASSTLSTIGDPATADALIAAMSDTDVTVRQNSATGLGKIKGPRTAAALIEAMKDKDPAVRATVAGQLGQIGVPVLIAALRDDDPQVRNRAADALARINDPRAAEPLLTALMERDDAVIYGAFNYFVARGAPDSEGALIQALNKSQNPFLAMTLLYSGNPILVRAGNDWAAKNGGIGHMPPVSPIWELPRWGSLSQP